jgi:hypothetical protein
MNDFTKEELITINGALNQLYDLCEAKLIDKIQSLIDNYCEHTNGCEGYNCSECKDCGARW